MKYPKGKALFQKVMRIRGITCDKKQTILRYERL